MKISKHLAEHAISELLQMGYTVDGDRLNPPEKLSDFACKFFGVSAPADSVTAPAGGVGAVKDWAAGARFALEQVAKIDHICWLTDSMREIGITQAGKAVLAERDRLLATPPAQAADSVLEDAALLKARHDFLLWNRSLQPSPIESSVEYSVFDKALELYDAARKQGANHD